MLCPKCKTIIMEMYERFFDYDDGETLIGQEHYRCPQCQSTFSRDVTYSLVGEGELEE